MNIAIMNNHIIYHHSRFVPHKTIQNWKTKLQRFLPTHNGTICLNRNKGMQ